MKTMPCDLYETLQNAVREACVFVSLRGHSRKKRKFCGNFGRRSFLHLEFSPVSPENGVLDVNSALWVEPSFFLAGMAIMVVEGV